MIYLCNNVFSTREQWQAEWGSKNVPKELSVFLKQLKANGNNKITDEGQNSIKRILSSRAAPLMTVDLLYDLATFNEVKEWFDRLNGLIQSEERN